MRVTDAQYAALLRAQGRPARQRTTLPAPSEYEEQCAVIEWAHAMVGRWPELAFSWRHQIKALSEAGLRVIAFRHEQNAGYAASIAGFLPFPIL
jgi:hypothetical protein